MFWAANAGSNGIDTLAHAGNAWGCAVVVVGASVAGVAGRSGVQPLSNRATEAAAAETLLRICIVGSYCRRCRCDLGIFSARMDGELLASSNPSRLVPVVAVDGDDQAVVAEVMAAVVNQLPR